MLTPDEVVDVTRDLWKRHRDELPTHDRVYDYVRGKRGRPDVPDGAGDELEDIAKLAVKNVLSLVRDAFAQGLAVTGYRTPDETENAAVWAEWQRHRLDARQGEPMRAAITYGSAYGIVTDTVRFRSPRQMMAVYADPHVDLWPVYALETWVDDSEKRARRFGTLYDGEHEYPLDFGYIQRVRSDEDGNRFSRAATVTPELLDGAEPIPHGNDGCPVVRFVNARDGEHLVVGEIEPLIEQQRAINVVNFDRLVVSRFGAFPQRYAIGWAPSSSTELAKVSMNRLLAFEDGKDTVQVGAFPAASVEPYNSILSEMVRHVAMTAQIPPLALTGDIENIAAEAAAMIEAPYQRKLSAKRESFGESWEQMLGLMASRAGVEVDEGAEVVWRDSESRAFGAVVDGITKLAAAGVPIETLLDDVPGWTQQQVTAARAAIRRTSGRGLIEALRGGGSTEAAPAPEDSAAVKAKADAMGVLIRAGVDPKEAAEQVGFAGIKFTGAVPVSLRLPEADAARLEDE